MCAAPHPGANMVMLIPWNGVNVHMAAVLGEAGLGPSAVALVAELKTQVEAQKLRADRAEAAVRTERDRADRAEAAVRTTKVRTKVPTRTTTPLGAVVEPAAAARAMEGAAVTAMAEARAR